MIFFGVVYAAILIAYGNVVPLTWTNPSAPDIAMIQFYAVCDERPADTLSFTPYWGKAPDEFTVPRLAPGDRDTLFATLPCRSDSLHWHIWEVVFDWAGNPIPDSLGAYRSNIKDWTQRP